MTIVYVIEYYRRVMDGREHCHSRFFAIKDKAIRTLLIEGYKLVRGEEVLYEKGNMRAILTERSVE